MGAFKNSFLSDSNKLSVVIGFDGCKEKFENLSHLLLIMIVSTALSLL